MPPRYIARPRLALDRLEEHGDGRLRYRFKKSWKYGTEAVLLEPLDFIARLAALVPPPRFHMLRYHGVFAANAKARAEVVPKKPIKKNVQLPVFAPGDAGHLEPPPEPSRHPWPRLLNRVFSVDISARFGRFPHGNAILGRPSTAEEEAFLKEPGSAF